MSDGKDFITKPELFMLDLLDNYQWDRPINLLSMGGDLNIGIKEYLLYDGFSYRFVPIKNKMSTGNIGLSDPDDLYNKMMNVYKWDKLSRKDYYVDYQNLYTFCGVMSQRLLFVNAAKEMLKVGDKQKALTLLDKCMESVPAEVFPYDLSYYGFSNELMSLELVEMYYAAGNPEKAAAIAQAFVDELMVSANFFIRFYDYAKNDFETACKYIYYISDTLKDNGNEELGKNMEDKLNELISVYSK